MAKKRYINTVFWDDSYISNLDPSEKLIFIYLITNPCTNISGVYQIPVKRISLDTGLEKDMVIKILERFQNDQKIIYRDGWISIKNFIKHQNHNSPLIKKCIEKELANVHPDFIEFVLYGIDTVSIPYRKAGKSISKSKGQGKSKSKDINTALHNEIKQHFQSINHDYFHNGKHGKAINELITRLKTKDAIINAANKLIKIKKYERSQFWTGCPCTPHDVNARYDQILNYKLPVETREM
jgi:hypothetical protein